MPARQNKNSLNPRRGVTLIEVMIVLAISGVLVVIAIGTLGARNSVLFESSARQVENDVKTVYSETISGLGPAGVSNTNPGSDPVAITPPVIASNSGEELFGQGLEVVQDCDDSSAVQPCLRVLKLKQTGTPGSQVIVPYERYRINIPAGFELDAPAGSHYTNGITPALSYGTCYPLVVFNTRGKAWIFGKPAGNSISDASSIDDGGCFGASAPASYQTDVPAGSSARFTFRDSSNSNKFFRLVIDLANPSNINVELP